MFEKNIEKELLKVYSCYLKLLRNFRNLKHFYDENFDTLCADSLAQLINRGKEIDDLLSINYKNLDRFLDSCEYIEVEGLFGALGNSIDIEGEYIAYDEIPPFAPYLTNDLSYKIKQNYNLVKKGFKELIRIRKEIKYIKFLQSQYSEIKESKNEIEKIKTLINKIKNTINESSTFPLRKEKLSYLKKIENNINNKSSIEFRTKIYMTIFSDIIPVFTKDGPMFSGDTVLKMLNFFPDDEPKKVLKYRKIWSNKFLDDLLNMIKKEGVRRSKESYYIKIGEEFLKRCFNSFRI